MDGWRMDGWIECNGMQGLYAQLTGEDLSLIYIYI